MISWDEEEAWLVLNVGSIDSGHLCGSSPRWSSGVMGISNGPVPGLAPASTAFGKPIQNECLYLDNLALGCHRSRAPGPATESRPVLAEERHRTTLRTCARRSKEMAMTVGFIGLGRMGQGMALNLARSVTPMVVFDQQPAAAEPVLAVGATWAASVAEVARRAEVVFTSLPGPAQVREVVIGPDGVSTHMRPGLALFDLSTSSVALAREIQEVFDARGGFMLDAPISGGPAGAAAGDLAIWVGGDRAIYDRHEPLLHAFASSTFYAGPVGSGTVIKLTHNMLGFMIMLSLSEAFSLGVKAGVDPLDLWRALRLGMVGKRSPLDMLVNQFLPGTYEPPAFALRLAHKDVTLATELARQLGVPLRVADLTLAEMTEAVARGLGDQDSRSYLTLQLQRAGVEIAVDPDRLAAAVQEAHRPAPDGTTTEQPTGS
jgi:3-hydroxyisobutyrate dehydrogenase